MSLLLKRHVHRHFPVFFCYNLLILVAAAARLASVSRYGVYFYVYWASETVLIPVGLAALHEVFLWVYEGFYRLGWFRLLYWGGIAAVLFITVRSALLHPPVEAPPLIGVILDVGNGVNLIRVAVVALFAVLVKPLNIEFRQYPFGVAAGIGLASLGTLAGYLARSEFGTKLNIFTQKTSAVSYIVGLVVWIGTFGRPERDEKDWTPPMSPEEMLAIVRGYLRVFWWSR